MTGSMICKRAATVIEECGWLQGVMGNPSDGFCATGAINYAAVRERYAFRARRLADARAQALGYSSMVDFNDAPGRTEVEVVKFLRAAGAGL